MRRTDLERVIAIDQGTTATKVFTLDAEGGFTSIMARPHRQHRPHPEWVEHDPEELVAGIVAGLAAAGEGRAIGLANQGETVVAWDGETGRPLYNAIVWQDARTRAFIDRLKADGSEALTLARAGLPLDPYFSASKLRWLLDHAEGAGSLLAAGRLRLGTSDAFFLDRLCGCFATDVTTASRTSLMNLATRDWDPELCRLFGVPLSALPPIRPTVGEFGRIGGSGTAVVASIVDQQAALFGHGCRRAGDAKITFGTGAFALMLTGGGPKGDPSSGLLPTVAWQIGREVSYALDGGVYNAGSAIDWLKSLGLFKDYGELDGFSGPSMLARGLVFVPALSGLGAPYWDRSAAGLWLGLGLETSRADLLRSALEGIALRAAQVLERMASSASLAGPLSIDGGLSRNRFFLETLAAATGLAVKVPMIADLTAYGVGLCALLGAGLVPRISELPQAPSGAVIEPEQCLERSLKERFAQAVERARSWR